MSYKRGDAEIAEERICTSLCVLCAFAFQNFAAQDAENFESLRVLWRIDCVTQTHLDALKKTEVFETRLSRLLNVTDDDAVPALAVKLLVAQCPGI